MRVQRVYRRLKVIERRTVAYMATTNLTAAYLIFRASFLIMRLIMRGVYFFLMGVSIVLAAFSVQFSDNPDIDDFDHPMHRTSWPERYDEWGSLG
jgi:magnesium-transporting ATPase (P-type)